MAFGIGFKPPADRLDGGLLADTGQHILQRAARGVVIQHLVGREQRHMGRWRDAMQPRQTALVVAAIEQARGKPHAIGAALLQSLQNFKAFAASNDAAGSTPEAGLGKFQEIVELQKTFAFLDRGSSPRLPRVNNWHSRP